jgi:hypothetical protein
MSAFTPLSSHLQSVDFSPWKRNFALSKAIDVCSSYHPKACLIDIAQAPQQ